MSRFDAAGIVGTWILAGCAVLITLLVLRREFSAESTYREGETVERIQGWETFSETGHRRGSDDADVVIVQFSDFQCPYCRDPGPILALS